MFRSYKDLIRTPKEADKPRLTQVYNCDMCIKGGWLSENEVEIHKKDSHFVVMHEYKAKHKDRFCTVSNFASYLFLTSLDHAGI